MADNRGRAPITSKDLREAKKRAKMARAAKMQNAPASARGRVSNKKLYIIIGIIAAAVIIIGMAFFIVTQRQPSEADVLSFMDTGVFGMTTVIEGVDVSGKTIDESRIIIAPALETKFMGTKFSYDVNAESFNKNAYELGLVTDIEEILMVAMLFEKTGNVFEQSEKLKILETQGQSYTVDLIALPENVAKSAKEFLPFHGVEPIEPMMEFNPEGQSEDDYFTWTDHQDGFVVVEASFVEKVVEAVAGDNFDLGAIELDVIASEKTKEDMAQSVVKLSEYTTFYGSGDLDDPNRKENIGLMSELLSGSVVKPGETWSINEMTGERTKDKGWQVGHSIRRGVLVDELGGGVCQVSSTLYNAVLEADVGIVERNNHTIKSIYVDRKSREEYYLDHDAADATIDYPRKDFKIQNTLDEDIYIIIVARTDRENEDITAMIFGPKPENDYKIVIRTIEESDSSKIPRPTAEAEKRVAIGGILPDGETYIPVGSPVAFPARKDGSVWYTYKYYYPKDYDPEVDPVYSWIGYVEGDNKSGEKYRIKTIDGDYLDSIYPAQNGVLYYNPEDPASYGLAGSTYDPDAVEDPADDGDGVDGGDTPTE